MRATRLRTVLADHDPRPERVGILRAVSAAARAPADVTPLARSLIRMGAKLAARASARSDWALLPGLMRASCFTSVPHAVHQAAGSGPSRAAAETAMRSTRALAVATGRPIVAASLRQPVEVSRIGDPLRLAHVGTGGCGSNGGRDFHHAPPAPTPRQRQDLSVS